MTEISHADNPCPLKVDSNRAANQLADIKDNIETVPFVLACKEPPGLLKDRPKTGLFVRSVVEKDLKGRTTRDLLKKVIAKVKERVSSTQFQIQNLQTCMSNSKPECAELKNWVDVELPQFIKAARFHLSLSQSQNEIKSWASIASKKVNEDLDTLGSYKLNDWNPLTAEEKARSEKVLKKYRTQIDIDARKENRYCSKCNVRFSEDALLAVRFQHYQTYHEMLSKLPVIQYLTGPLVSKSELNDAFSKMKKDLDGEAKQLAEYEKLLATTPIPTDALDVLNYSSQLEEVLLENNNDCGLATSLLYTKSNRQTGNAIAIGLPILAVSFLAAPVVLALGGTAALATAASIGTGVVSGSAMTLKSYSEFQTTQKRTLGYIYGDNLGLGDDLINLEGSLKKVKYDVATLPVGFGLAGMATRSLSVGVKSLRTGRKIFESTTP